MVGDTLLWCRCRSTFPEKYHLTILFAKTFSLGTSKSDRRPVSRENKAFADAYHVITLSRVVSSQSCLITELSHSGRKELLSTFGRFQILFTRPGDNRRTDPRARATFPFQLGTCSLAIAHRHTQVGSL